MTAFVVDDAALSPAEIELLLRAGRRGDPKTAGRRHAALASGRLTALLSLVSTLLWCADLLTFVRG